MKANEYQNKISDVNKQARGEIYALMQNHNIDEINFKNILKKNDISESDRAVNPCLFTEADRLREMLDDHPILMNTGVQIFSDCSIVSIRQLDGEYLGVEYEDVDGGYGDYTAYTDAYTTLQILGLLEDFFNEFEYDPKTDKISFNVKYRAVKVVDGEVMPLSGWLYDNKSDAVKEMLKTVANYSEAEIVHIEIDNDRVRLQTKNNIITYQVYEGKIYDVIGIGLKRS